MLCHNTKNELQHVHKSGLQHVRQGPDPYVAQTTTAGMQPTLVKDQHIDISSELCSGVICPAIIPFR